MSVDETTWPEPTAAARPVTTASAGVGTESGYLQVVAEAVGTGLTAGGAVAVLFVDVDGFDEILTTMGNELGDVVMAEVAHRLRQVLRPHDVLIHPTPGTFVIVCQNVAGTDVQIVAWLATMCERLRQQLIQAPDPGRIEAVVSIGIGTVATREVLSPADLVAARTQSTRAGRQGRPVVIGELRSGPTHVVAQIGIGNRASG